VCVCVCVCVECEMCQGVKRASAPIAIDGWSGSLRRAGTRGWMCVQAHLADVLSVRAQLVGKGVLLLRVWVWACGDEDGSLSMAQCCR